MATTPNGSWHGSESFGVRDIFESARTRPEAPQAAMEQMNRALLDLGITKYRVDSITKEMQTQDTDLYTVVLISTLDNAKHFTASIDF